MKKRLIGGLFLTIFIGGSMLLLFRGCSENISPEAANVALNTNGKTYLYSVMGDFIVQNSIEKGESPALAPSLEVYKNNDDFYVAPIRMKALADVMAGDTKLYEYKEPSYDGYAVSNEKVGFEMSTKVKTTETIGEQITAFTATLRNADGEEMRIEWEMNPSTAEYKAISNCEVKSFWVQTNPSPGETVISGEDFLVVHIDKLAEFYKCSVTYDPETRLFFVSK